MNDGSTRPDPRCRSIPHQREVRARCHRPPSPTGNDSARARKCGRRAGTCSRGRQPFAPGSRPRCRRSCRRPAPTRHTRVRARRRRAREGGCGRAYSGRLRSQRSRSPCERQLRVELGDRLRERRDERGEAARRDRRARRGAELVADADDEPVDGPRSRRRCPTASRDACLADHVLRRDERHLRQPRGAREERVQRDLDAGREHAAEVLALRRDDVEVRRRAEVDDDRRPALRSRPRPRPRSVGADLARVLERIAMPVERPGRGRAAPCPPTGRRSDSYSR